MECLMEEELFVQICALKKKLLEAQKKLEKISIGEPIIKDLLQNLIQTVDDKLEEIRDEFGLSKCPECDLLFASGHAFEIHKKMIHK